MLKACQYPAHVRGDVWVWADQEHSSMPPPEDSISWQLWQNCQDIAEEALNTKHIQGIKNGTLDPRQFGHYSVQDATYCYNAQNNRSSKCRESQ